MNTAHSKDICAGMSISGFYFTKHLSKRGLGAETMSNFASTVALRSMKEQS
jgi:hypothetical protein